jgi:hypothetical protein
VQVLVPLFDVQPGGTGCLVVLLRVHKRYPLLLWGRM